MLSAPSSQDLQHAAGQFAAIGKLRGGRSAPPNLRPWLLIENLHRVKKFNYPEVFFPSRETIQHEKDKQTGLAAAVIWSLHNSTVLTKELSQSSQLIGPSTLQPSPKLRVVNKRTPSVDISFLQRAVGSLVLPPCSSPGPPETRRPGSSPGPLETRWGALSPWYRVLLEGISYIVHLWIQIHLELHCSLSGGLDGSPLCNSCGLAQGASSKSTSVHVYWLTVDFLRTALLYSNLWCRSKKQTAKVKFKSTWRDGNTTQGSVDLKTPSRRGRQGWFQKIKSYLQKWDVGQHLGNLLSIVAFIQEIQLQWNVLLSFLHQPRKRKVWEEPMNHLHQHLEVTWKTWINSKCVCRCTTMMHTTYFLSKNLQELRVNLSNSL